LGFAFLLNSRIDFTGAVIGVSVSSGFSSILGLVLILVSVVIFAGGESLEDEVIKFYHGAIDRHKAEEIRLNGPSVDRGFFITRIKSLAEVAAGPNGTIITFEIPKDEAKEYLNLEGNYFGWFGDEGTQIETKGELAKKLKNYLSKNDQRRSY